jgi:hypothetical protein
MGLEIMKYCADMIGAEFKTRRASRRRDPSGGITVMQTKIQSIYYAI